VIRELRDAFNARYDVSVFERMLDRLQQAAGGPIPFRLAESPIFVPRPLLDEMQRTSLAIIDQLTAKPSYKEEAGRHIPATALVPGGTEHPLFVVFDYAIAKGPDGAPVPRLTEMQGFPSLYALQDVLARALAEAYDLPSHLTHLLDGLDVESMRALVRSAVMGDEDPEHVALVDVKPWEQGTWPDFKFLQTTICPGLSVVDAADLVQRGSQVFRRDRGREVPVKRIFNRMVFEDLEGVRDQLGFDPRTADVAWAGHPNDFFYWSKVSLPHLRHPNVPRTAYVDDAQIPSSELARYVLKPLFSFSGRGLVLDPDQAAVDAIPSAERGGWILQEKFQYAEAIRAVDGGSVGCELRLLYIWQEKPVCVTMLPRMSRGRIMGCAYNKTDPWTGHGVALTPSR
jgi:hypothetical protein